MKLLASDRAERWLLKLAATGSGDGDGESTWTGCVVDSSGLLDNRYSVPCRLVVTAGPLVRGLDGVSAAEAGDVDT